MSQRILVPVDGSPTSDRGLSEAIDLARQTGGRIRLLHVLDELVFPTGRASGDTYVNDILPRLREGGERILAAARQRVVAAGVPAESLTARCFARRTADVVVEQAVEWKADLVVIGTHGRRGVGRMMLGSDAEQIARMAPVPVLLVRGVEPTSRLQDATAASNGERASAAIV
jgi:nucleotide-binding universal stress UspA family protein